LQAHLADAFVAAVKDAGANNNSLRIVAETHSESIVNRLGEIIASNQLKPDEVNVLLFERESAESPSKVSVAEYDERGYLTNWPFGFFNATAR
jgi:predicted ATPase